ncbi:MAG: hypothetical protein Kow00109_06320 [Acidobacteriota bacterium]
MLIFFFLPVFAEKPAVEEILERHAGAVGSVEHWRATPSLKAEGICRLTLVVGGSGTLQGKASFASRGAATALRLDFGHGNYGGEAVVFDGRKKYDVAFATPGQRSMLGEFLFTYDEIVKDGLLGGVLSTAWPLLRDEKAGRRMKSEGLQETEGAEWWRVSYRPRRAPRELDVDLYFEPESFRLRKSEYEVRRSYGMGPFPGVPSSAQVGQPARRDVRMKFEEVFDDYQDVQGLTLPRLWKIRCTNETNEGTLMWEWVIEFTRFELGGEIAPEEFRLE